MNESTAPQEVKEFISYALSIPVNKVADGASLFHDFGVDGADAEEFISEFSRKFNVNLDRFIFKEYFGVETSSNPLAFIGEILTRSKYKKAKRLEVKKLIEAAINGSF